MSYGVRVFDENGNVILNIDDRITRLCFSTIVSADESGSVNLPDIEGKETVEFSIPLEDEYRKVSHTVTRDGTTISWQPANVDNWYNSSSLIFVFVYT